MKVLQTTTACGVDLPWSADLKAHHFGDGAQIGIKIGVERGVVVVDGAVRIFETISGLHTDHRCSVRNLCCTFD